MQKNINQNINQKFRGNKMEDFSGGGSRGDNDGGSGDPDISALERARKELYGSKGAARARGTLSENEKRDLPHAWENDSITDMPQRRKHPVRLASIFFVISLLFFIGALGAAGYFFYFGANAVSADKITIDIQGQATIAAGDTLPLSISITNKNAIALDNAIIEIDFPNGTLSADGALRDYPRYTENLGKIESGATITRSVKAVVLGVAGQSTTLPISFSYGSAGSNATFVKKTSYALTTSSTPVSLLVSAPSETVSGKPLSFILMIRSNTTVPLKNVILTTSFPFGFSVTDSSSPINESNIMLGSLSPGESKTITINGILTGQNGEQRVSRFSIATAKEGDKNMSRTPALIYMSQDASVVITAPFIATTLSLNGDTRANAVVASGAQQNVTVAYTNMLKTSIANAKVSISLSGEAVDFNSIQTTTGFYNSTDRTITFSRDTDQSLAALAPGVSGIGSFTFSTLSAGAIKSTPTIMFTVSVSGERLGQTNVPEEVQASFIKTAKVVTTVLLSTASLHSSGPIPSTGAIPPRVGQETQYTIVWNARNGGSSIANGIMSATLPNYVSYTGITSGAGAFSFDKGARTVTWNMGNIAQFANVQGAFQVSFTPSSSQIGNAPILVNTALFSGYDRFAGVDIKASADPVTTETKLDPGYVSLNAIVQ